MPSPHHDFIRYKTLNINEEFLFVAFRVDGPGTAFSLFTVRMLCANTLPMNALGSPSQATVKPAGDHLCAICWNGIYILGLDYLVVSFCIESTLWVVSNKPCSYSVQPVSALIISKQACNDCTACCLQEKASFPYFNSGYAEAWMNPHRRRGKRPILGHS